MKIAIASGKGGTGKTMVATNLFHVLRKHNYEATLVDCDAEAPNALSFFNISHVKVTEVHHLVPVIDEAACTFCGKCHEYCRFNAIFILPGMKVIHVLEDLCHGCGACSVACKYHAITEQPMPLGVVSAFSMDGCECLVEARMKIGTMSPVQVIRAAVDKTGKADGTVILDSPPGTACPFIHTVASADYIVLVTEPTPFGLSDLQQSVETLKTLNKPYGVIINRAGKSDGQMEAYLKIERIPLLLEIPFDREIARIYSTGGMVVEEFPELEKEFVELVINRLI